VINPEFLGGIDQALAAREFKEYPQVVPIQHLVSVVHRCQPFAIMQKAFELLAIVTILTHMQNEPRNRRRAIS
jgi:hypothetical protein